MTHDSAVALRADGLGKRYGRAWGLRDCTFAVPAGSVVGLVGPNGAGKTTLLALTVGLLAPTEGQIAVFGEPSRAYTAATLAQVSYLAQDHPLYRGFSVADMLRLGRSMNPRWDQTLAQSRIDALGIPLQRKIKALSGGQQAQVSLTMALAKRAPLLALDEPVASLDPIARLDFMRDVMAAAADSGLTVIIASHVISELERLCDWLELLDFEVMLVRRFGTGFPWAAPRTVRVDAMMTRTPGSARSSGSTGATIRCTSKGRGVCGRSAWMKDFDLEKGRAGWQANWISNRVG